MSALFASGQIVDLIVAAMVVEACGLLCYRAVTGRGIVAVALLTNILAGAFLLMALHSALLGYDWFWTAAWLGAALVAHIADLAQRWQT